jgi:hypothetical protein
MTEVWKSLSLRISYAKAVLVGVLVTPDATRTHVHGGADAEKVEGDQVDNESEDERGGDDEDAEAPMLRMGLKSPSRTEYLDSTWFMGTHISTGLRNRSPIINSCQSANEGILNFGTASSKASRLKNGLWAHNQSHFRNGDKVTNETHWHICPLKNRMG